MRYLIVDDDAVYRSRLRTALEKRGHSVMAAPSTDEAINLLKTELFWQQDYNTLKPEQ
jgi:ActR/RegA family two-component response regulator